LLLRPMLLLLLLLLLLPRGLLLCFLLFCMKGPQPSAYNLL
jgi:hypothetical protein